jgi:hypothetical protein
MLPKWYQSEEISFDELNASVQGWVNHVRYGNTVGLRKALFAAAIAYSGRYNSIVSRICPSA